MLRLADFDTHTRTRSLHLLVDVEDLLLGFHDAFLLASDGQFVFDDRERRDVDANSGVFSLHAVDVLIVRAADERMVFLGDFEFFVGLLRLWSGMGWCHVMYCIIVNVI